MASRLSCSARTRSAHMTAVLSRRQSRATLTAPRAVRPTSRVLTAGGTSMLLYAGLILALVRAAAAAPPPNDDFANAAAITPGLSGAAVTVSIVITEATKELGEILWRGDGSNLIMQKSAWYTFAVPANAATMTVSANACR